MKIAYICADPGIPVFGCKGCSIHVQALVKTWLKQGHEVMLFAARLGGKAPLFAKLTVYHLPKLPKGTAPAEIQMREQAALGNNVDLRLALERFGPFDLIYERYSLWSYGAIDYAADHCIPGILEVNAPLIEEQAEHRGLVDRDRALWTANRVFGTASGLVAVSKAVATYLQQFSTIQGHVEVIPNGVDPTRFLPPIVPTHPKTGFTVGFVGTMKPWHDLSTLMMAFAQFQQHHPDSRLLMVGKGPLLKEMETIAATLGCASAVHFTGAVSPNEIPGLLASMDVAVAPYPHQENCYFSPLKVYEYMAAGLPVVASAVGQLTELIDTGETGFLYPPGDVLRLVAAFEQLRSQPALRQRLGAAAHAKVLEYHTWNSIGQQIVTWANQSFNERQPARQEVRS